MDSIVAFHVVTDFTFRIITLVLIIVHQDDIRTTQLVYVLIAIPLVRSVLAAVK